MKTVGFKMDSEHSAMCQHGVWQSYKTNLCKVLKAVEKLTASVDSLLFCSYLLHLPLLLLNNLIQQGLEAVLWEERDKQDLFESTCWASLNCDGFKCVSAWVAHVTISSPTERPLGMPVRDSWPFPCDCDNNDWRWGSDGPKTPGNESSKWQRKKRAMSAHVSLIVKSPLKSAWQNNTFSCHSAW